MTSRRSTLQDLKRKDVLDPFRNEFGDFTDEVASDLKDAIARLCDQLLPPRAPSSPSSSAESVSGFDYGCDYHLSDDDYMAGEFDYPDGYLPASSTSMLADDVCEVSQEDMEDELFQAMAALHERADMEREDVNVC